MRRERAGARDPFSSLPLRSTQYCCYEQRSGQQLHTADPAGTELVSADDIILDVETGVSILYNSWCNETR